jgi:UDP-N-acetylmuramyl pentapeptide phosphotransferase/UDP-N-acetylglucosamine-1-phosphate transferase
MVLVAAGMFIAYVITFFLLPFVIRIARVNKLFDLPDERKTHTYPVSSLGGVGIISGLAISLLLVSDFKLENSEFQYYLASFFIIFIIGVIDDIFVLRAWKKLLGQLLVASLLTVKAHLLITNLQGLGGVFAIKTEFSYVLTFNTVLLVINSFNLIDGIDGLAGSLGLISSLSFGLYFYVNGNVPFAILGFVMSGSLLAFLMFNFPPAKIFMGDSGSMLIGLVNVILLIKFIETANSAPIYPVSSPIAIGFAILLIPMLDVLRVFIIRLTKGVSPFAPDRNHLHHLLLNQGFSHTKVTSTLLISEACIIPLCFYFQGVNVNVLSAILILAFFTAVFVIKYFGATRKPLRVVKEGNVTANNLQDTKVLTLYTSKENAALNEE